MCSVVVDLLGVVPSALRPRAAAQVCLCVPVLSIPCFISRVCLCSAVGLILSRRGWYLALWLILAGLPLCRFSVPSLVLF